MRTSCLVIKYRLIERLPLNNQRILCIGHFDDRRLAGSITGKRRGRVQLGYALAQAFWGKGYATEAVMAVTAWALSQPGFHRVGALCDLENVASQRVLEKAGFQREGVLRRWEILPNLGSASRDVLCYGKAGN